MHTFYDDTNGSRLRGTRFDATINGIPINNRRTMDYEDSSNYANLPSYITQDPNLMWSNINRPVKIEDLDQNMKIFPIEEDDSVQMTDNQNYLPEPTLSSLNNAALSDFNLEEFLVPMDLPNLERIDAGDSESYNADALRNAEELIAAELRNQDKVQDVPLLLEKSKMPELATIDQRGYDLQRDYQDFDQLPDNPRPRHGSIGSLQQALQRHSINSPSRHGQSPLNSTMNFSARELLNRKRTLETNSTQETLLSSSPKFSLLNPPTSVMPFRRSPGHEPSALSPLGLPPASTSRNQSSSSRYRQRANTLHGFVSHRSSTHSPSPGPSRTGRISSPGPSKMTQHQGIPINPGSSSQSRLCSSAPTHTGLDIFWQRREPRQHLLSTSSIAGDYNSISSLSGSVLSPTSIDASHDEGFDSEDDSEHENYDDVETESDCDSEAEGRKSTTGKKERYFWQYNVQSKGPKGRKVVMQTDIGDPHFLDSVKDPVFDIQVEGVKHSGKARRGDGNDLTPSPRKLASIGKELDKLNRLITDMIPVSELPAAARSDTRKEKNKLASRVCRLKKKAQHEANKLKLYGLQEEHKKMMNIIGQVKQLILAKHEAMITGTCSEADFREATVRIDALVKHGIKHKVAGHTADYVNRVIDRVYSGDPTGAINDI
ncbi:protein CREBRF homolog isoform X2 [Artemia franciscana]|uniref:BZIP domain-containing protein n=1 Tax=Artemia franciscana TaxID=6661 RepID=A0AA88HN27_ARTSF|nr:hypothetical protein QYM36_011280 [Artemia franciscana]